MAAAIVALQLMPPETWAAPGITPTPNMLTVAETGPTNVQTFTVTLEEQPDANVTVNINSGNENRGTASPSNLTFTSTSWDAPQTVTVTGVHDYIDQANQTWNVVLTSTSQDTDYNNLTQNVTVTTTNTDSASVITTTMGQATEWGGIATLSLRLGSQPHGTVTADISSTSPGATLLTPNRSFGPGNWNQPQTIEIRGNDDSMTNSPSRTWSITIEFTSTQPAADNFYHSSTSDTTISGTIFDDDAVGIATSETSVTVTEEAGNDNTATFEVRLGKVPTAAVTVDVTSTNTDEGTVSPASLTFGTANWNQMQTVTVTGVNDGVYNGNGLLWNVVLDPSSSDSDYNALDNTVVSARTRENDEAGITVSEITGQPTETGDMASFTVVLDTQPAISTTITVTSSDPGEGTASPISLTFGTANWNQPQTVTVTGMDDIANDGDQTYEIMLETTQGDAFYNALPIKRVDMITIDDDEAGITVSGITGQPTETGGMASFTVVLDTQPVVNTTITVTSSDLGEGTVSPASLTFGAANWNQPQTVTVTGMDDNSMDGTQSYEIVLKVTAGDADYRGLSARRMAITTTDAGDTAGVTITETSGATEVSESGTTDTFTVVLDTQPTANVVIRATSSDPGEGTASPISLTFGTANWNQPQTVTVTGVGDSSIDGTQTYSIVLGLSSTDDGYGSLSNVNVSATTTDVPGTAGVTITETAGATTVSERGTTDTFTVVLDTQPTADVMIAVTSGNTGQGKVSKAGDDAPATSTTLTFGAANWNRPQTVTVTGVRDYIDQLNQTWNVTVAAPTSSDGNYSGLSAQAVSVLTTDNDSAGIIRYITGMATERGDVAVVHLKLGSKPHGDITLTPTNPATGTASFSTAVKRFGPSNWNQPQTIEVTGINDNIVNSPTRRFSVSIASSASNSGDGYYNSISFTVREIVLDDDAAGFATGVTSVTVTEAAGNDNTATFVVKLGKEPTADVTVAVSSSNTARGTVSPASLTFGTANWNQPQTVTATGVNDDVDGGDRLWNVVLNPSSTDSDYNSLANVNVLATTTDDDQAGITITETAGATTVSERGTTDTFTVVLDTQPTVGMTINILSGDASEALVSKAGDTAPATSTTLRFSTSNWNQAQTVTVTGVNDDVVDGDQTYAIQTMVQESGEDGGDDPNYVGVTNRVRTTTTDDDAVSLKIETSGATEVSESGTTDTFIVTLGSEPTGDIGISISSNNENEGTVNPTSLVFSTANWNSPQTVTVTGMDDNVADGDQTFDIVLTHSSGYTSNYNSLSPHEVRVTTTDDDNPGVTATPRNLVIMEGGSDTYTLKLDSVPVENVTITIASSDGDVIATPAVLTFTAANWNGAQTVTVSALADMDDYAEGGVTLSHTVGSYGSVTQADTVAVAVSGDHIIGDPPPGTTLYSISGQWVTVTVEEDVPKGVEIELPTLTQAVTVTLSRPAANIPSSSGTYALTDHDGVGVMVDVEVSPLPTGGAEICLPVSDKMRDEAGMQGENLLLMHYNENRNAWEPAADVAVIRSRQDILCAGGLTEFSPFAVGYASMRSGRDDGDTDKEKERARLRDINEAIIPELARALTSGVVDAITDRLQRAASGDNKTDSAASLKQLLRNNSQALEDGTFKWRKALNGKHFAMPLKQGMPSTENLTLWSAGNWKHLSLDDKPIDWDGDVYSYQIGIDADLGDGKIAGVAASWFESDVDYKGASKGDHESEIASLHPYIGWTMAKGARLWATLGYGEGEIEIDDDQIGNKQDSDSILKTAAAGGNMRVYDTDTVTVDLKGEGWVTQWRVKNNGDLIDGLKIDTRRLRVAAEATRHATLESGAYLTSSLELGARYDGGDGETGHGAELGGSLDYDSPATRVKINANGRVLLAHRGALDEWGLGGAIELSPRPDGRGLALRISPTYGHPDGNARELWEQGLALKKKDDKDDPSMQLETEISYGMYHARGLLTPYLGMSVLEEGHRYRIGGHFRLSETLTLNVEGDRLEKHRADTDYGIILNAGIRW